MREIKFRAWDKWNKVMLEGWYLVDLINEAARRAREEGIDPVAEDLEWLEYTGLHDKNGKEIYEGDIVKTTSELMTGFGKHPTGKYQTEYYSIEYDDEAAQYKERRLRDNYLLPLGLTQKIVVKYSEIIGNIHENKELLEGHNASGKR